MLSPAYSPLRPLSKGAVLAARYEVLRVLGSGSLGTTYLARDRELGGSRVALKVLHASLFSDEQVVAELKNRVGQIRQLSHPNVCRCYDLIALAESSWLIAMEYVPGGSLSEIWQKLRGQRLRAAEALHIGVQILRGLQFAHQAGVVHGNLHPGNILVSREGGVKVADFLINSAIAPELGLTRSRTMLGVPRYLAPEQISAESAQPESDVFAAAVIIAELLGDVRAQSASVVEQMSQQFELSLAHFGLSESNLSPELALSLSQALTAEVSGRPENFDALLAALERELSKSSVSGRATITEIQGLSAKLFTEQDIGRYRPLRITLLFLALVAMISALGQDNVKSRVMTTALVLERALGIDLSSAYRYLRLPPVSVNNPDAIRNAVGYPKPWLLTGVLRAGGEINPTGTSTKSPLEYIYETGSAGSDDADNQGHKLSTLRDSGYMPALSVGSSERLLMHRSIRERNLSFTHQLITLFPLYGLVRDDQGKNALDLASELNASAAVNKFLEANLSMCTVEPGTGRSAAHWAAMGGSIEALEVLRFRNCVLLHADAQGKTPIHLALESARDRDLVRTLELLLSAGKALPPLTADLEALAAKRGVLPTLTKFTARHD